MYRKLEPYNMEQYVNPEFGDWHYFTNNIICRGGFELLINKLPNFKYITKDLICRHRNLTSLKGCPLYVGGHFNCGWNQLMSLKGCPIYVGGNFIYLCNTLILELPKNVIINGLEFGSSHYITPIFDTIHNIVVRTVIMLRHLLFEWSKIGYIIS